MDLYESEWLRVNGWILEETEGECRRWEYIMECIVCEFGESGYSEESI